MPENQETVTSDIQEENSVEPSETSEVEDSSTDTTPSEEYEPTDEELATLDDDEFDRWVNTNEFPESKKIKNKDTEEEKTEETKEKESTSTKETKEEQTETTESNNQQEVTPTDIDYKGVYERLFKPFKANGKEISPRSVEDIITLMQKGANYTKKMQDLAPMRQAAESLIRAGIDNKELSFLIDLHSGNKDAIKKLLKDNKIEITDFDPEEEISYQPTGDNIASKADIEFQDALLDSKKNLDKIKDILYNVWDEESREKVLQDPELLRGLNTEIELGRFDQVQKILENEKVFGRSKGKPDIIAYIELVNELIKRQEENNSKSNTSSDNSNYQTTKKQTNRIIPNAGDKTKAAPSKGKPTFAKSRFTPEEIMNMPEEEFLKLSEKDLI